MSIRLCKWGNSTGLRIPAALLASAGLQIGRYVTLRVLDCGEIRVRPVGQVVPAEPDGSSAPPTVSQKEEVW
jgi:antitoxin component of MazEF toxin-antitoxin module